MVPNDYNVNSEEISKHASEYKEEAFFDKVKKYAKAIGVELLLKAFQLYYVLQKPELPPKVKAIIMGALAYLVLPIDLVPDIIPGIGYVDDLAVVGFALLQAMPYIDDEVTRKANESIKNIFG